MITCEELDSLFDKLCDLTRQLPNMDRIREATELLDAAESAPRRFVMQWRAAAAADLFYLEGTSLRSIGEQAGNAFQGVSQWLIGHGPTHYLAVRKESSQRIAFQVIDVDPEDIRGTRAKIRKLQDAGARIVPATWNAIVDGAPRPTVVPDKLWEALEPART